MNIRTGGWAACIVALLCAAPFFALASQEASVVVRPGVVSPPLDAYFDLGDALSVGVNQSVKIIVSAYNTQKTAVKFKDVYLINAGGAMVGVNVAKADALQKDTPVGFIFQNFGVSPAKLKDVVGVRMTFISSGGDDPTDIVKVSGVQASVIRDVGESCVSIDQNIIEAKEKPLLTADQIVNNNRVTSYVGSGDTGGGGGGGGSNSVGPNSPTLAMNNGGGAVMWSNPSNVMSNDGVHAVATTVGAAQTANLDVTGFHFMEDGVPSTATINGIVVEVDRGVSPGASAQDATAYLIYLGGTTSNNRPKLDIWPASFSVATYGTPTDAAEWGISVTASVVRNSTFGFRLSALISQPNQAYIDHIQMTVYYSTGGSIYDAFADLLRSFSKRAYCLVTFRCGK